MFCQRLHTTAGSNALRGTRFKHFLPAVLILVVVCVQACQRPTRSNPSHQQRTSLNVFDVSSFLPAFDVGAGVVGFLTNRAGVGWEIRRFQNIGGKSNTAGLTFGPEDLSFWRATMMVAIRY